MATNWDDDANALGLGNSGLPQDEEYDSCFTWIRTGGEIVLP